MGVPLAEDLSFSTCFLRNARRNFSLFFSACICRRCFSDDDFSRASIVSSFTSLQKGYISISGLQGFKRLDAFEQKQLYCIAEKTCNNTLKVTHSVSSSKK
jgi:hypothetical protein